MPIKSSAAFAAAVLLAAVAPAGAMTLDQAMEICSKQYGHLYDTNGAPRMASAIEQCATQKVREAGDKPEGGKRKKK